MTVFEYLYANYRHAVYWRLLGLTHSHEQAEDLTQETFLKALRFPADIEEQHIRGWLFAIATHTFIDAYRKRKLIAICSLEANALDCPVERDEDARLDALAVIAQAPVILLLMAHGYSHKEIAERMGCSIAAVKMAVMRARRKLREKVVS